MQHPRRHPLHRGNAYVALTLIIIKINGENSRTRSQRLLRHTLKEHTVGTEPLAQRLRWAVTCGDTRKLKDAERWARCYLN